MLLTFTGCFLFFAPVCINSISSSEILKPAALVLITMPKPESLKSLRCSSFWLTHRSVGWIPNKVVNEWMHIIKLQYTKCITAYYNFIFKDVSETVVSLTPEMFLKPFKSSVPVDVAPEERVLEVLQRIAAQPTPEPLASKLSSHLLMDISNPWLRPRIPSSSWWWHIEKPHPETKRRQNLASYNLNSFGLRYGKWHQAMATEGILLKTIKPF